MTGKGARMGEDGKEDYSKEFLSGLRRVGAPSPPSRMGTERKAMLEELRTERDEVREEWKALGRRLDALERSVHGLEMLFGEVPAPPIDNPVGAEAIREVLRLSGREMSTADILEELQSRGWAPASKNPINATASNAARACTVYDDVVRRRSSIGLVYRYGVRRRAS